MFICDSFHHHHLYIRLSVEYLRSPCKTQNHWCWHKVENNILIFKKSSLHSKHGYYTASVICKVVFHEYFSSFLLLNQRPVICPLPLAGWVRHTPIQGHVEHPNPLNRKAIWLRLIRISTDQSGAVYTDVQRSESDEETKQRAGVISHGHMAGWGGEGGGCRPSGHRCQVATGRSWLQSPDPPEENTELNKEQTGAIMH